MLRGLLVPLLALLWALPAAADAPPDPDAGPDVSPALRALDLCRAGAETGSGPSGLCQDLVLAILTNDADLFLTHVEPNEGFTLERRGVETPIRGQGMLQSVMEEEGGLRSLLGMSDAGDGDDLRVEDCTSCRTPHLGIRIVSPNGTVTDVEVYGGRVRYVRVGELVCHTGGGRQANLGGASAKPDTSTL